MGEFSLCKFHDKEITLESRMIYFDGRGLNARNSTNHYLKLNKGDIVSLIHKGKTVSEIKKDGIIGYTYNTNLKLF